MIPGHRQHQERPARLHCHRLLPQSGDSAAPETSACAHSPTAPTPSIRSDVYHHLEHLGTECSSPDDASYSSPRPTCSGISPYMKQLDTETRQESTESSERKPRSETFTIGVSAPRHGDAMPSTSLPQVLPNGRIFSFWRSSASVTCPKMRFRGPPAGCSTTNRSPCAPIKWAARAGSDSLTGRYYAAPSNTCHLFRRGEHDVRLVAWTMPKVTCYTTLIWPLCGVHAAHGASHVSPFSSPATSHMLDVLRKSA